MKKAAARVEADVPALAKAPTGIQGLDEITGGGLPAGRPTLVAGSAGAGKTLFAMEFLVNGAREFGEPGVFMSFEERSEDLAKNVASLGFDIPRLVRQKKLFLDYVKVDRSEIEETGEYDLEALFVRLAYGIDQVKAKRVVLDTIEALFGELPNPGILRAEIRRLFYWLKERGVTAVITGERDRPETITRHGLEEFVSDCVILLDHRVREQISTRRMRIVKYRGSSHGTNEYPFLIDENGFSVLPLSSLGLKHAASNERISTGIERLDGMLDGKGYYRGNSVLVSGTAGSGKSTLAAHFVDAACRRGERALYFAFEESPQQIMRNMRSVGINLAQWVEQGLLRFHAQRPTFGGIEQHLVAMHQQIGAFDPSVVIVDPVTNLVSVATRGEVQATLTRLIDHLKVKKITALFTSLTTGGQALETSEVAVSSLMDTWLLLEMIQIGGERNRALYVLKSRGMAHSNQVREFILTKNGVQLIDVYTGPEGVLTGSARVSQEARERAVGVARQQEIEIGRRDLERKRRAYEARLLQLRAEMEWEIDEISRRISAAESADERLQTEREAMRRKRDADQQQASGAAPDEKRAARGNQRRG